MVSGSKAFGWSCCLLPESGWSRMDVFDMALPPSWPLVPSTDCVPVHILCQRGQTVEASAKACRQFLSSENAFVWYSISVTSIRDRGRCSVRYGERRKRWRSSVSAEVSHVTRLRAAVGAAPGMFLPRVELFRRTAVLLCRPCGARPHFCLRPRASFHLRRNYALGLKMSRLRRFPARHAATEQSLPVSLGCRAQVASEPQVRHRPRFRIRPICHALAFTRSRGFSWRTGDWVPWAGEP